MSILVLAEILVQIPQDSDLLEKQSKYKINDIPVNCVFTLSETYLCVFGKKYNDSIKLFFLKDGGELLSVFDVLPSELMEWVEKFPKKRSQNLFGIVRDFFRKF